VTVAQKAQDSYDKKQVSNCGVAPLHSICWTVLRPGICSLTFLLLLVLKTKSRGIQSRTAAHAVHNVVWKSLFLFTAPTFLPINKRVSKTMKVQGI